MSFFLHLISPFFSLSCFLLKVRAVCLYFYLFALSSSSESSSIPSSGVVSCGSWSIVLGTRAAIIEPAYRKVLGGSFDAPPSSRLTAGFLCSFCCKSDATNFCLRARGVLFGVLYVSVGNVGQASYLCKVRWRADRINERAC